MDKTGITERLVTDHRQYYSILEVSEKLAIPIQKLRRWDQDGVLKALRSNGGHRRYAKELIDGLAAQAISPDKTSKELTTIRKSLAEKQRVIQLLLESEHRYRDLVETSHDLIWITDPRGRITYLNNAARDMFGVEPSDLYGRCLFDFQPSNSLMPKRRFLAILRRHGEVRNFMSHVVTAAGVTRWIGVNGRAILDENNKIKSIRGTARDITEHHLARMHIEHLAMHDPLTDLPNRIALQKSIEEGIASGGPGAVLFLEIDHFNHMNDNFGHRVGDQMIKGVGSALRALMREFSGDLFRLGGGEFAIHVRGGSLRPDAVKLAEHALETIRRYRFQAHGAKGILKLSASIGIALYPFHGADVTRLLSNVDIAISKAKEHGRNRYMLFDQSLDHMRSTHKRVHLIKKLQDAIDHERLVLFSQPVVRLADEKIVHHEILSRIRGDDAKILMPSNLIEIAESGSLLQEFDLHVLEKLLLHMHQNNQMGKKLRYFVNLTQASISDQKWIKRFVNMLSMSKADPGQLVFEITETAAMSDIDVTLNFVRNLKDLGSRFALDGFGAGFSSFYYLQRFEVDYIKIDGSFVSDLAANKSSQLFIKALNNVAQDMHKEVIAQSIETPPVRKLLQRIGTLYGQGYLFGRPMPLHRHFPSNAEKFNAA